MASAMLAGGTVWAADQAANVGRPAPGVLALQAGSVRWGERPNLLGVAQAENDAGPRVLVLDGPMTDQRRAALAGAGVELIEYLPRDAFIADLSGADAGALARLGFVRFIGAFDPAWKVSPGVGTAPREGGAALLRVWLFAGADAGALRGRIAALPGLTVERVDEAGGSASMVVRVSGPAGGAARALSALDGVQWVEDAPRFSARDVDVPWIMQSNTPGVHQAWDRGLSGAGQIVGVIDGWIGLGHCAFDDPGVEPGPRHRKLLAYNTFQNFDRHGTWVAAIAAGDPLPPASPETRGVAYRARIVFNTWPQPFENTVFQAFALHASQGARIHNNSWGNEFTNRYDGTARAVDEFSWLNDDNLLVFAVSNFSLIKNPENAKNALAVTATGNAPQQGAMCVDARVPGPGRGPTADGRRKPDLAAPGCGVVSAASQIECLSLEDFGTSGAAPAVSGAAALLRQYFTEGWHPAGARIGANRFEPAGALLKAALAVSAEDLSDPGYPTDREGWGRPNLAGVLVFPGETRRLAVAQARNNTPEALSTGGSASMRVEVVSPSRPLRAALAFHDAPAALNASFTPVNDLDLEAVSPSGVVYRGNGMNSAGVSVPGAAADAINTIEQIIVPEPEPGVWTLRVAARAVNVGRQGFGVAATFAGTPACPADINADGTVDFNDLLEFLNRYNERSPQAELTGDGVVDQADLVEFLHRYNSGC
jgi:hypothetical protein